MKSDRATTLKSTLQKAGVILLVPLAFALTKTALAGFCLLPFALAGALVFKLAKSGDV
jgi:hypothetical protein